MIASTKKRPCDLYRGSSKYSVKTIRRFGPELISLPNPRAIGETRGDPPQGIDLRKALCSLKKHVPVCVHRSFVETASNGERREASETVDASERRYQRIQASRGSITTADFCGRLDYALFSHAIARPRLPRTAYTPVTDVQILFELEMPSLPLSWTRAV